MSDPRSSINPQDPKVSTESLVPSRLIDIDRLQYSHPTTATQSIETSPGFLYQSQGSARDSVKASNFVITPGKSEIEGQAGQASTEDWKRKFIQDQKKASDLISRTDELLRKSMANSSAISVPYTYPEVRSSVVRSYEASNIPIVGTDPISVRTTQVIDPLRDEHRYPRTDYRYSVDRERYVSGSPQRDYIVRSAYSHLASPVSDTRLRSTSLAKERFGLKSNDLLNRGSYTAEKTLAYRDSVPIENGYRSQNISRLDDLVSNIRTRNIRGENLYSTPIPIRTLPLNTQSAGPLGVRSYERPREDYAQTVKKSYPIANANAPSSELPPTFKPDLLAGFRSNDYRDTTNGYRSHLGYVGDRENKTQIERILSRYKREEEFYDPVSTISHRRFDSSAEKLVKSSPKAPAGLGGTKVSKKLSLIIAVAVIVLMVLLVFGFWWFF